MSNNKQPSGGSFPAWILWTAVDAAVIYAIWKYIAVPQFGWKPLLYGPIFVIVAGLRTLCDRLFSRLDEYHDLLVEIRDIQLFNEQRQSHQFEQMAGFIDKHFDKIVRAAVETEK